MAGDAFSRAASAWWGHFGLQPTGQTLIREGGVWSAVSLPTQTRLEDADEITDAAGSPAPGYFLGGHIYTISQVVADELTAQGFGASIT